MKIAAAAAGEAEQMNLCMLNVCIEERSVEASWGICICSPVEPETLI
jgi:hypothetical protein